MSLYSLEEICIDCLNAVFHKCCNNFCKCKDDHEDIVNYCFGTCEEKIKANDKVKIRCIECMGGGHKPFYIGNMYNGLVMCPTCNGTGKMEL